MSSRKQPIIPRDSCHFLTFNIVDRIDLFVRPLYKQVITNALNHFVDAQGLIVYAWCLMNSHIHLLVKTREGNGPAYFERDFKKFTTPQLLKGIEMEMDPRRSWMMRHFEDFSISLKKIEKFNVWQNCSSPLHIDCQHPRILFDHIGHIHDNPVRDGIVELPESYLFSSARDYAGMKGLVKVKVVQLGLSRFNMLSNN
jgi:REP-associated tyrosine transposase